jgi:hypothetical protein
MYLEIFKERMEEFLKDPENQKEKKNLKSFQDNLFDGINYYKSLFAEKKKEVIDELDRMLQKYSVLHTEL